MWRKNITIIPLLSFSAFLNTSLALELTAMDQGVVEAI